MTGLITVNLDEFIEKVKVYQRSSYALEDPYSKTLKRRDIWDRLSEIDEQKTRDVILKFLNAWKCRLSYKCSSNLTKALRFF